MVNLVEPLPAHRLDEARLSAFLAGALPELATPVAVQQFQGGQSNPTYLLTDANGRRYALRKKPPGAILPSAHAVEREYTIMRALGPTGVPVPNARLLCEDPAVIGTPFYLMDYVDGAVHEDVKLAAIPRESRAGYYLAMADALAALHRVDWRGAGLESFGRPDNYVARQIARWTRQYEASDPEPNADMEGLIAWLPAHVPGSETASIAHGDFRLGNLIFAHGAPRLRAILDWELSTIGDPFSDLAYLCSFYRLPHESQFVRGLAGLDLAREGIPDENALLDRYAAAAGLSGRPRHWPFYLAFSLFRSAAIGQGVYDRSRRGNAADARAHLYLDMARTCARTGAAIAAAA